jgi:hypothetical protein
MVSKTKWFMGLGLTLPLLLSHACAALTIERVAGGILLQGEIVNGDSQRFSAALNGYGNLPILLHSGGGLVSEALRIAELARAHALSTHLPAKSTCASACVLILAGGVVRTAHPSARIGVHMGSGILNDEAIEVIRRIHKQYGAEGAAIIGARFEQAAAQSVLKQVTFFLTAGVSLRLLQLTASVDHLDIRWLTTAEAKEFNLVNAE